MALVEGVAMSRQYPDRPIVGVGAVIWRGDAVLLIRRGQPPRVGQWSLPGGAQHLGETLAEAVAREVHEETGLTLVDLRLLTTRPDRARSGRPRPLSLHLVDFSAEAPHGQPSRATMLPRSPGSRRSSSPTSGCGPRRCASSSWQLPGGAHRPWVRRHRAGQASTGSPLARTRARLQSAS